MAEIEPGTLQDFETRLTWLNRLGLFPRDPFIVRFMAVLLAVFILKQMLMVVIFPAFSGHDEVAHFAYIQTVTTEHRVPELLKDDIPDFFYRYCLFILDWSPCEPDSPQWLQRPFRFADWGSAGVHAAGQQYAANHPPLYYLMVSPVFRLTEWASPESQHFILRLVSVLFGVAVVVLALLTVHAIFPGDRFLAVTVPAFVAFQPQVSYEAAMVNNDVAGIAALSLVLFLLVRGIRRRFPVFDCVLLGVALAAALLIKGNSIVAIPVIALTMIAAIGWRAVRNWVGKGAIVAGIAAAVSAPWYVFLYRTYGNFDGLDQVEEMQEPWNHPAGKFFGLLFDRDFVWGRWQETWGAFGWRRIQLTDWLLWLIAAPVIVAVLGLALYSVRSLSRRFDHRLRGLLEFERPDRHQVISLVSLAVFIVVSYLAILQFGTRFVLTQSRYLFPAVNATAILLMVGLRTLIPRRARPVGQAILVWSLIMLNVVIYTKFVIPYWHMSDW